MKKRSNISNLPVDKLKQEPKGEPRSGTKQAEIPLKQATNNKNKQTAFDAWDDRDNLDFDVTTNQILAEKETFEILAQRGYETLEEYPEGGKQQRKL